MDTTDIAIIGAGPYGLAIAVHLLRAQMDVRVFGLPMSFWRSMPMGMLLRSSTTATSIAERQGPLSLEAFRQRFALAYEKPVTLDRFIDYGEWVQREAVPDLDRRTVEIVQRADRRFILTLEDGQRCTARRVVVAGGIAPFAWRPPFADDLPPELASHTSDHIDLSRFAGTRVLVVGGGQSALESAALLHEGGAEVEVLVRADHINWLHGGKYEQALGPMAPLLYAPTDVGPMGLSRLIAATDLYRRLPRPVQDPLSRRAIRPAGSAWLSPRLRDVPIHLGVRVRDAAPGRGQVALELADGTIRIADHVVFGTGYRIDIRRYPFLAPELLSAIRTRSGYPALRRGFESTVQGLHFVGAAAAYDFGPTMRFVSGSWYAGRELTRAVVRDARARRPSGAGVDVAAGPWTTAFSVGGGAVE
jgi:cation diffusion facilitator CzcD-associated flavoprotein CzcO